MIYYQTFFKEVKMTALQRQVKHYAVDNNVTITAIAEQCGLSYQAFYCKLNNKRSWWIEEACILANMLGITLEDFVTMMKEGK